MHRNLLVLVLPLICDSHRRFSPRASRSRSLLVVVVVVVVVLVFLVLVLETLYKTFLFSLVVVRRS